MRLIALFRGQRQRLLTGLFFFLFRTPSEPGGLERGHPLLPLLTNGRRPLDHRHLIVVAFNRVEVDRHDQITMRRHHRHNRQRIKQAAVNQHAIALTYRGKQTGNRRRGAHGLMQTARLKPHFLLVGQVGGDGGKGYRQIFDVDIAEYLADSPEHPLTANRAQGAKADIQQADHIQVIQTGHPLAVISQPTGSVNATHHRAH